MRARRTTEIAPCRSSRGVHSDWGGSLRPKPVPLDEPRGGCCSSLTSSGIHEVDAVSDLCEFRSAIERSYSLLAVHTSRSTHPTLLRLPDRIWRTALRGSISLYWTSGVFLAVYVAGRVSHYPGHPVQHQPHPRRRMRPLERRATRDANPIKALERARQPHQWQSKAETVTLRCLMRPRIGNLEYSADDHGAAVT